MVCCFMEFAYFIVYKVNIFSGMKQIGKPYNDREILALDYNTNINLNNMIIKIIMFCFTECETKCWWPSGRFGSNRDILLARRPKCASKFYPNYTNASSLSIKKFTPGPHSDPASHSNFPECCFVTAVTWYQHTDWGQRWNA